MGGPSNGVRTDLESGATMGAGHTHGINLGTIPPEYALKPWYKTEDKAKRANKITCFSLTTKQDAGCSNHPGRTNPFKVNRLSPCPYLVKRLFGRVEFEHVIFVVF
jgi:hypothetical protein